MLPINAFLSWYMLQNINSKFFVRDGCRGFCISIGPKTVVDWYCIRLQSFVRETVIDFTGMVLSSDCPDQFIHKICAPSEITLQ
jgi:hypothetical protein